MPSTTTPPRGAPSASTPKRFLRLPQVCEMVGLGRSAIYAAMKDGSFPLPVKLGTHVNAWRLEEIQAWMEARPRNVEVGPEA